MCLVYTVIIKEKKNVNSYASDQFPTAISKIWFLLYEHVILLSFISYLIEFSESGHLFYVISTLFIYLFK